MFFTSPHNKAFSALLEDISLKVKIAKTETELIEAIQLAEKFNGPLEYDNKNLIILLISLSVILMVLLGNFFIFNKSPLSVEQIFICAGLLISIISLCSYLFIKKQKIEKLSDLIYTKDTFFDNQLKSIYVDKKHHASALQAQFLEFDRGNHSREIRQLVEGTYKGKEHTFTYYFYHFHYVDKVTTTTTVKGRAQSSTSYHRYDRYGIYLPFGFYRNIIIKNFKLKGVRGIQYKPASYLFNKHYSVFSQSEIDAAKFLKPAVVIAFEELLGVLKSINFEVNALGHICLSFSDHDMLKVNRKFGLKKASLFIREIKRFNHFLKLKKTLVFLHFLMKQSDSNF